MKSLEKLEELSPFSIIILIIMSDRVSVRYVIVVAIAAFLLTY